MPPPRCQPRPSKGRFGPKDVSVQLLLIALLLLFLGVLLYLGHLRRQIQYLRILSREAQK